MPTTTSSVSSALACPAVIPCPATRYGTPQSSPKTVPQNWVPVWVHSPSRVPGSDHDGRSPRSTSRGGAAGGGGGAPGGRSRTTASTASPTARPTPAAREERRGPARAVQQRGERHRARAPARAGRRGPVSCVITGTRRGGNHAVTTESTLMNVSASPVPTSTRAAMARGSEVASASTSWPAAIVNAPDGDQRPAAEPVEQQPDGHLQGGVDQQLQHHEPGQRRGAAPGSAARRPARPRRTRSGASPRPCRRRARPTRRPRSGSSSSTRPTTSSLSTVTSHDPRTSMVRHVRA